MILRSICCKLVEHMGGGWDFSDRRCRIEGRKGLESFKLEISAKPLGARPPSANFAALCVGGSSVISPIKRRPKRRLADTEAERDRATEHAHNDVCTALVK